MGIKEKFGGPGNVVAIGAATGMEEVVIANYLRIGIGEELERESGFAGEVARDFRGIDADRYGNDAGGLEFGKLLLDASQLEGAERSPVAAIENQENGFRGGGTERWREESVERDCGAVGVGEVEVGGNLAELRGLRGGRDSAEGIEEEYCAGADEQRDQGYARSENFCADGARLSEKTFYAQGKKK